MQILGISVLTSDASRHWTRLQKTFGQGMARCLPLL